MKGRYGTCRALTTRGYQCQSPATGWVLRNPRTGKSEDVCLRHYRQAVDEGGKVYFVSDYEGER